MMQRFAAQGLVLLVGTLLPSLAFALTVEETYQVIFTITQDLILLIIGVALLVFLWGIFKYFFVGDDAGKKIGRTYILWGIIALFVMVSVWGLVNMLRSSFRMNEQAPAVPEVETKGVSLGNATTFERIVQNILSILDALLPIMIGLGTLFFIWGVFQYVRTENAKDKGKAAGYIAWGVFILFVMVSAWALVHLIGETTGINTQSGTSIGNTPVRVDINALIKK
ncbi:MAG: hypothetical protein RL150_44 [Candidatus Parcubacteria bacterium]|jgi:uncharacterized membrane protein YidH (DUF202 family)